MKFSGKMVAGWWLPVMFLAGIILGIFIMTGTGMAEKSGQNGETLYENTEHTSEVTAGRDNPGRDDAVEEGVRSWEPGAVYTGGDYVLYNGKYYRAKWWTQNETPGRADVWEDTGEAPEASGGISGSGNPGQGHEPSAESGAAVLPDSNKALQEGDFRIVAYYPSWTSGGFYNNTSISEKVQFDKITHLVYAFAIPTSDSRLLPLDNEGMVRELVTTAHGYGVKVMLAVGGWSHNDTPLEPTFNAATINSAGREKLADAIYAMCKKYGFDGVDLDWEHPRVDGESGKQYEALVQLLADRLHADGLLLSCAVLGGATADGNIYYDAAAQTDHVLETVDWINVMAYDGGDGERHSTYEFAADCGRYWRDTRGVPGDKINLGVPFYGRPGWASYDELLKQDETAWNRDKMIYNGMEAWYNGADTIRAKTRYAAENLGGIMIWEITQDSADREKSLLSVIWKTAKMPNRSDR